jgi:vitamin B12 transporter
MKFKQPSVRKSSVLFREWTRKKYAVFSSLNKIIKICTLIAVYTMISDRVEVSAQADTVLINDRIDLEEVEIIGQRSPGVYNNVARVVAVISHEEIESAPVQSLNDLFEFLPHIDIRQRGILGVQADLSIRGGSFDQGLVLLNGIPVNDPQTGHHNLNLPVDISNIKRIEILQGPGSRVYGANAFSGAINIITFDGTEDILRFAVSAGQHNLINASGSAGGSVKKIYGNISFMGRSTSGYTDNTDFKSYNLFVRGGYLLSFGKIGFQAGYLDKAFGANSFYSSRFPEQYEHVKNKFAALDFTSGEKIKTDIKFAWRRHHDRFELFREDRYKYSEGFFIGADTAKYNPASFASSSYYRGHNYHLTDIFSVNYNNTFSWLLGTSSAGIEYKTEHIMSNVLGNLLDIPVEVKNEERGFYTKKASRDYTSIFAEHIIRARKFTISGGILASYNNEYGFHIYSGAEISRQFLNDGKLFLSGNQSLRLPTFTDLYYNGPSNIGNPDLKPERAITVEIGHRKKFQVFHYQVSAFSTFGKDIIDWVKLPDELIYKTMNHTALNTSGFEFSAATDLKHHHQLSKYINHVSLSYSYIKTGKESGEFISAYVLDYLKHKFTFRMFHPLYKSLNFSWNLTFQDRNGTYTADNSEHAYQPFAVVNSRLFWKSKFYTVYFEAYNIFNTNYRDFGNISQPGRWLIAGVNVTFM